LVTGLPLLRPNLQQLRLLHLIPVQLLQLILQLLPVRQLLPWQL
jgi:hypothetical protein